MEGWRRGDWSVKGGGIGQWRGGEEGLVSKRWWYWSVEGWRRVDWSVKGGVLVSGGV